MFAMSQAVEEQFQVIEEIKVEVVVEVILHLDNLVHMGKRVPGVWAWQEEVAQAGTLPVLVVPEVHALPWKCRIFKH